MLQQMFNMLPSWLDALYIPAEDALVYSLEFFPGNC
jgi:hypothetical protein